jgi:DNA-3-methyladenine glycosylase
MSRRAFATRLPGQLLAQAVFRQSPAAVAQQLLGKLLVRVHPDGTVLAGRIVETEAYLGDQDAASHAFRGVTARNAAMFGPAGHAYVYFTYGMHYCMNVVCGPAGEGAAVLLRALEPLCGREAMLAARGLGPSAAERSIAGGPARLAQAFGITRERDDGKLLLSASGDLQLRDDKFRIGEVVMGKRIGITRAAELPLRFYLAGNRCVSR